MASAPSVLAGPPLSLCCCRMRANMLSHSRMKACGPGLRHPKLECPCYPERIPLAWSAKASLLSEQGAAASRSGSETSHTAAPQMLNPSVRMVARPRSGRCPSRLRMSAATDAVALELAGYWHCHACAVLTLPSCRQRLQLRRHGELQPAAEFAAFNSVSCTQKILSVSGLQLHSDRQ